MVDKREAAERWRGIIAKRRSSGLSVAAYCRRAGVPQSSFYAWQRRLRDAADFVEVRLPLPSGSPGSAIELRLAGRRSVMIRSGFDRRTLADLVAALESIPCGGDVPEAALRGPRREVVG